MNHQENHSRARLAAMAAVMVGTALLTAACGGSSSSTGSGSSPDAGGTAQSQQLAFARCMRAHGVTDYPDSGVLIQPRPGSDLDPNNPIYRAARQACQSLLPRANVNPAQAAQNLADALKFSKCMREHGITNFPDPGPHDGPGGGEGIYLGGIDFNSPQYQAAKQACRHYQVSGKEGP
jgi:hypothetical protein